jgi:hypothetical protein
MPIYGTILNIVVSGTGFFTVSGRIVSLTEHLLALEDTLLFADEVATVNIPSPIPVANKIRFIIL